MFLLQYTGTWFKFDSDHGRSSRSEVCLCVCACVRAFSLPPASACGVDAGYGCYHWTSGFAARVLWRPPPARHRSVEHLRSGRSWTSRDVFSPASLRGYRAFTSCWDREGLRCFSALWHRWFPLFFFFLPRGSAFDVHSGALRGEKCATIFNATLDIFTQGYEEKERCLLPWLPHAYCSCLWMKFSE